MEKLKRGLYDRVVEKLIDILMWLVFDIIRPLAEKRKQRQQKNGKDSYQTTALQGFRLILIFVSVIIVVALWYWKMDIFSFS